MDVLIVERGECIAILGAYGLRVGSESEVERIAFIHLLETFFDGQPVGS
ncbi:MAG: hypothetical protein QM674_01765 [Burkholderiaceae bacterium]